MNSYFEGMRRYASFSGRTPRRKFWGFTFVHIAIVALAAGIDIFNGEDIGNEGGTFLSFAILVHFVPALAIVVRRLHDANRSGWQVLLTLIPGLGFIFWIVFAAEPSTPGRNRYGLPDSDALDSKNANPNFNPSDKGDYVEKLEKLAALRSSGTIDEDEFRSIKTEIMGGRS